jgi:Ca-activated chloride channel family protein
LVINLLVSVKGFLEKHLKTKARGNVCLVIGGGTMNRKLLIVMLMFVGVIAGAQTTSIRGTVVDPSQALIPGVTVQMENLGTGEKRTTITDEAGRFAFLGLSMGKVRITASLPGFQTWTREIELESGGAQLAITLNVASTATMVEVTSPVGAFSTQSSASVGYATGRGQRRNDLVDRGPRRMHTESYDYFEDNPFTHVSQQPRSTFAVDVDTASYTNVRRIINEGRLPPRDAVRIEEFVNYFKYEYAAPTGTHPVAIHAEVASAPWQPTHRLVRIGIRAKDVDLSARKSANLVFLIDVSGSMQDDAKLPLVQRSLHLLVDRLRDDDTVTMVVYAGSSGLALPPTKGDKKDDIHNAIDRLSAGGSTNGGEGIQLAYRMAAENYVPGGINRVILATDGDFNVGVTNEGDLVRLVQQKAQSGVFLTVLGYGIGNYKDSTLEKLADKGHGNYAYIDTINEAKRVLVEQLSGTLLTVAKDVKLQVEFNPSELEAYRLIGYENRILADADFDNDKKQGGDMGASHNVTALFEVVPKGIAFEGQTTRPLKYQKDARLESARKGEFLTVSLRYKMPEGNRSSLLEKTAVNSGTTFENASADFRFAASVASFGMLLRDSPHKGASTMENALKMAADSTAHDPARAEFVELVRKASLLYSSR